MIDKRFIGFLMVLIMTLTNINVVFAEGEMLVPKISETGSSDKQLLSKAADEEVSSAALGINLTDKINNGIIPLAKQTVMPMISAGGQNRTTALKSDGTVWCWGDNYHGALGKGITTDSSIPVQIQGLTDVIAVAGESNHAAVVKSNRTVWCWGYNYFGALGDGTKTDSSIPIQVQGLTDVIAVCAGAEHTAALKKDGTVWCWGDNWCGLLGDGTTTDSLIPIQVQDLTNIIT